MLELRMNLKEHETKLWRFYTSEVLYPLRFAERHSDMAKYRPPVDLVCTWGGKLIEFQLIRCW